MFQLFYVFLFGFIMGMVSYVFILEDEPHDMNDMVEVYEKKCKADMLHIYEERLKQD